MQARMGQLSQTLSSPCCQARTGQRHPRRRHQSHRSDRQVLDFRLDQRDPSRPWRQRDRSNRLDPWVQLHQSNLLDPRVRLNLSDRLDQWVQWVQRDQRVLLVQRDRSVQRHLLHQWDPWDLEVRPEFRVDRRDQVHPRDQARRVGQAHLPIRWSRDA